LALYLLSFIICFERDGWYQRKLFLPLFAVALFVLAYLPTMGLNELPIFISMGINLVCFFIICMVCHGELAMQQPNSQYLTTYYLMLAIGGVLGGFFVGVIAPHWFNENYELSIGILLAGIVVALVFLAEIKFKNNLRKMISIGSVAGLLLIISSIRINDHHEELSGSELSVRNFYGTLKVYLDEKGAYRTMQHGQISHGTQNTTPSKVLEPTTYYIPESGVGKAILIKKATSKSIKVGVVGLGVGTLAGYGRSEDTFRFYEINPQVIEVANQKFSFLSKSPAKIDIVLGDARLQLENESSQEFDILVIDAFSGDSVPIHLLTQEAFAQYFRHLKTDGILALHITNRFLDLRPVIKSASDHFGKDIRVVNFEAPEGKEGFRSDWALVTKNKEYYKNPLLIDAKDVVVKSTFKPWKDDYSSLVSVMK
jgi:SAM-dependent methyltransferase